MDSHAGTPKDHLAFSYSCRSGVSVKKQKAASECTGTTAQYGTYDETRTGHWNCDLPGLFVCTVQSGLRMPKNLVYITLKSK